VVKAARQQIGVTIHYDPTYTRLAYPNGDVPQDREVCTDVVIRALRTALRMDLQKLIHDDMRKNFARYPKEWGLSGPDPHIDHRRVLNMQIFFTRQGWSVPPSNHASAYQPGDFVTCIVPPNLPRIMIVSDTTNDRGMPLIIHNIGNGARKEDRLFEFKLTGYYRLKDMTKVTQSRTNWRAAPFVESQGFRKTARAW
jgi:uncharacterized protein